MNGLPGYDAYKLAAPDEREPGFVQHQCDECKGTGSVMWPADGDLPAALGECDVCNGTGVFECLGCVACEDPEIP